MNNKSLGLEILFYSAARWGSAVNSNLKNGCFYNDTSCINYCDIFLEGKYLKLLTFAW